MAQRFLPISSQTSGAVAEVATNRKLAEYAPLTHSYSFVPIATETMGAINSVSIEFLGDLRRRITRATDDKRESAFLFHRLSVLLQRYIAVVSFSRSSISVVFSFCFVTLRIFIAEGRPTLKI